MILSLAPVKYGLLVGALAAGPSVGPPVVTGPRSTSSDRPAYRFRAVRAVSFRCAFDSKALHFCPSRYSERLSPGSHVLRVRAVGRRGALSRVVSVKVVITVPYAKLVTGKPVQVGGGAGVPAVDGGTVSVPLTDTGELARVDQAAGTVSAKVRVGAPSGGRTGFLDSAVAVGGSIWYASDAGGTITRIDGAPRATVAAGGRPGGLTIGGGAVWAFNFLAPDVIRVDLSTAAARTLHMDGVVGTGIAYGGGVLWVLSTGPSRILKVDPASGAVLSTYELKVPFAAQYSVIESWWLAYGDGAVWATLPNYGSVARLDVATGAVVYARTPYGRPFGIAVGGGSAWVATDHGVLRLDATTGAPTGVALLPSADRSGFASIAYGDGAAWFTNYDLGTLTKVSG